MSKRNWDDLKRRISDLGDDGKVTYTLKDGSQATISKTDSTLYTAWVIANADPNVRDSEGSFGHSLDQSMSGCSGAPFESWEAFKARNEGRIFIDNPMNATGDDCLIHEDWMTPEKTTVIFLTGDNEKYVSNRNHLHSAYQGYMLELGTMREIKDNASFYYVPYLTFEQFEAAYLQWVGVPLRIDPLGDVEDENNRSEPPEGWPLGTWWPN